MLILLVRGCRLWAQLLLLRFSLIPSFLPGFGALMLLERFTLSVRSSGVTININTKARSEKVTNKTRSLLRPGGLILEAAESRVLCDENERRVSSQVWCKVRLKSRFFVSPELISGSLRQKTEDVRIRDTLGERFRRRWLRFLLKEAVCHFFSAVCCAWLYLPTWALVRFSLFSNWSHIFS